MTPAIHSGLRPDCPGLGHACSWFGPCLPVSTGLDRYLRSTSFCTAQEAALVVRALGASVSGGTDLPHEASRETRNEDPQTI